MKYQLPKSFSKENMSVEELMKATARMNQILEIENGLLAKMKVVELMPYRQEKEQLTKQLESYQKLLATDTSFVANVDTATREELLNLTDDLAFALQENLRRTAIARAANQRVMQTITEALSDHQRVMTYGRHGKAAGSSTQPISLNLNQRA